MIVIPVVPTKEYNSLTPCVVALMKDLNSIEVSLNHGQKPNPYRSPNLEHPFPSKMGRGTRA